MNELVKEHLTQKDAEVQEMIVKLTGKFDEMEIKHQVQITEKNGIIEQLHEEISLLKLSTDEMIGNNCDLQVQIKAY